MSLLTTQGLSYLNCVFRIREGNYCSCKDKTEYGFWFDGLTIIGINNVCSVCDYFKENNGGRKWIRNSTKKEEKMEISS